MLPTDALKAADLGSLKFILCDIDDTLTRDGYLLPEAYTALWKLKSAGFIIIPVTGRPAGWCDMIIRQWPVEAVIGENGAFCMIRNESGYDLKLHPDVAGGNIQERLREIEKYVCGKIPGMKTSRDQDFRWYDLALDFAEDPPRFDYDTAVTIKKLCEEKGAVAKISSIHVNTWFGEYSKLDTALMILTENFDVKSEMLKDSVLFCGDSPNDEPMFSFFPLSCGMANIRSFLNLIEHKPGYITENPYGAGFSEVAEIILESVKKNCCDG